MEFYEYLRKKESTLIDAIGLKNFKEEKVYFVNEVEAMVEDYIKFKKLVIADVSINEVELKAFAKKINKIKGFTAVSDNLIKEYLNSF